MQESRIFVIFEFAAACSDAVCTHDLLQDLQTQVEPLPEPLPLPHIIQRRPFLWGGWWDRDASAHEVMLYKLEGLAHQWGFVTLVRNWISLVCESFSMKLTG